MTALLGLSVSIILIGLIKAVPIDNEIVGPLNITCQPGAALINFKTKNPFHGRVYIKGAYSKSICNRDYGHANQTDEGHMTVPFRDCGMQRDRMPDTARGIKYVTTIVISFHPMFITKVDRAYRIECIYQGGSDTVSNSLDVSELPTQAISIQPQPPDCQYRLHLNSRDGPEPRYANVGDTVFHVWSCDSDIYTLFVHSCFVSGPGQQEVELLDETGCSLDPHLMPNLTYSTDLNRAWTETSVFRYQEIGSLRFNCKIYTCLKDDTECLSERPRQCIVYERLRQRRFVTRPLSQTIYSPELNVNDVPDDDQFNNNVTHDDLAVYCINRRHIVTVVISLSMVSTLALVSAVVAIYYRVTKC